MRRPAVESFSVVDPAGRIWWARPDQFGSWEWGSITLDLGAETLGDGLSRLDAIEGLTWEAETIDREAAAALEVLENERYEGRGW